MILNVLLKNARTNDFVLCGSRLDNAYGRNLEHISPMYILYLKASLDNA